MKIEISLFYFFHIPNLITTMNPIYRAILGCILFCIFISGTAQSLSKNKRMPDPQPPGMVLIKSGSIEFNQLLAKDSLIDTPLYRQGASFSSFWMDKHEVTNQMYREFVVWVRDSIIRERLADPNLGDNELFKIDEDEYGDPISPYLDWSQKIPWKNGSDEELAAIESLFCIDPISGEKRIDEKQLLFTFEWFDSYAALKYGRLLLTDKAASILITKDTAYLDTNGAIVTQTIERPLSSRADFTHTYIIPIYPDEYCWITDFKNSNNSMLVRNYFTHTDYNEYPVVGVSWHQAMAYCQWRTMMFRKGNAKTGIDLSEEFRLPTEGEWEYAARAGNNKARYPWRKEDAAHCQSCFVGNFKPGVGDYTSDGALTTSSKMSYQPNAYGLFDMAGNVSEWTASAYFEAGHAMASDINPFISYRASQSDPDHLKQKVVRGGSWKDVSEQIRSDLRGYAHQDATHSFVGFRCVKTVVDPRKQ